MPRICLTLAHPSKSITGNKSTWVEAVPNNNWTLEKLCGEIIDVNRSFCTSESRCDVCFSPRAQNSKLVVRTLSHSPRRPQHNQKHLLHMHLFHTACGYAREVKMVLHHILRHHAQSYCVPSKPKRHKQDRTMRPYRAGPQYLVLPSVHLILPGE